MQEVKRNHKKLLDENQHIKYLWIPYTDAVVVVTNNPVPEVGSVQNAQSKACFRGHAYAVSNVTASLWQGQARPLSISLSSCSKRLICENMACIFSALEHTSLSLLLDIDV